MVGNLANPCSGFEEATITERNAQYTPTALEYHSRDTEVLNNAHSLIKTITVPLKEQRGIEAFRDKVIEAECQLCSGLVLTPRELEITLIQSGRVGRPTPNLYCSLLTQCSGNLNLLDFLTYTGML